jgi:ABC-type sugar transport system ATPase subunit
MSKISQLVFKQDEFRLDIPELEIAEVGVTAITGHSGSGKTTFFKILLGIYQPDQWSWIFNGQEMSKLDIQDRQLGVVFQNYELFPHLSAEENITLVMKSRNNWNQKSQDQLEYFKNKLKLETCWKTEARKLSGGEQQRVALLRAVLSQPKMILLDEPFSALDKDLKQEAYQLVKQVLHEAGLPALMITHNSEEAKYFTSHIIEFKNGKIV